MAKYTADHGTDKRIGSRIVVTPLIPSIPQDEWEEAFENRPKAEG